MQRQPVFFPARALPTSHPDMVTTKELKVSLEVSQNATSDTATNSNDTRQAIIITGEKVLFTTELMML